MCVGGPLVDSLTFDVSINFDCENMWTICVCLTRVLGLEWDARWSAGGCKSVLGMFRNVESGAIDNSVVSGMLQSRPWTGIMGLSFRGWVSCHGGFTSLVTWWNVGVVGRVKGKWIKEDRDTNKNKSMEGNLRYFLAMYAPGIIWFLSKNVLWRFL